MLHPSAAQVTRRLADQQTARIGQAAEVRGFFFATVTTVVPGGARDGNALVEVTWFGAELTANGYANSYTPIVGDRVKCSYDGQQVVVDYKVIGHP